jgi:hypothetical protein
MLLGKAAMAALRGPGAPAFDTAKGLRVSYSMFCLIMAGIAVFLVGVTEGVVTI